MGIDPESGVCRVSMTHYTRETDVQGVVAALDAIL